MSKLERYERVREEWLAIVGHRVADVNRFADVKRQADILIDSGRWTSGPSDMLSVLGRQRDELIHSRLIGWMLVPTNRHGLGRSFLSGFLGAIAPGEDLSGIGTVRVDTEVSSTGLDQDGASQIARADIVVRGDGLTIVIENKLDAGEQPDQCERLYWAWRSEPGDTRWVFLSPTGRAPVTTSSEEARRAWLTLSYAEVHDLVERALAQGANANAPGRPTVTQYLSTLAAAVAR